MTSLTFRDAPYDRLRFRLRLDRDESRLYIPKPIRHPRDVLEFMYLLAEESAEHMYQLVMDGRNRVSGMYLVGKGGCSSCVCDPKEIYKAALVHNTPAFILAHNHPSGDPSPSREDVQITRHIREGADLLGLKFMDHIIIGYEDYASMKERGLMDG